jgi:hypothetical protein
MYLLVRGPDGRPVELTFRAWDHVRRRHPEITDSLLDIVLTIEHPIYREPDIQPGRERLFRSPLIPNWDIENDYLLGTP